VGSRKLDRLQDHLADNRSHRVVFVSHCLLNQNVRYLGGAAQAGGVPGVVNQYQDAGVGIYQMPCPEQRASGGVLKRYLVPMYGSAGTWRYSLRRPLTWVFLVYSRLVYAQVARRVVRDLADYVRSGLGVVGIVGVGASPSCGVFQTLDVPRSVEVAAACPVESTDTATFNPALMSTATTAGSGYFIKALRRGLKQRHLVIPFCEHDLVAELRENSLLQ
jgi:predicted secreted protein